MAGREQAPQLRQQQAWRRTMDWQGLCVDSLTCHCGSPLHHNRFWRIGGLVDLLD